jgi:cytoskeletal protein CcmA (bactofilin family)
MLFKQNAPSGQPATTAEGMSAMAKPLSSPTVPSAPMTRAPAAPTMAETTDAGKRLIVGQGIQMKGEITACDRLIVEGQVEVTLKATRMLEIKPTGHFTGSCEVEEADVSGVYDGNLTVRGRLIVHAGGRVTGDISYGEIELERGAQITGKLSVRDRAAQSSGQSSPQRADSRRNAA